MSEKIEEIAEFYEKDLKSKNKGWNDRFDGYRITTNKRIITIAVSSYQSCCETFGNISTPDNFHDFIGADVLNIRFIEEAKYSDCEVFKNKIPEQEDYLECKVFDCAFINIETSEGLLQFAVYNSHNGYYGHDIFIKEEILTK